MEAVHGSQKKVNNHEMQQASSDFFFCVPAELRAEVPPGCRDDRVPDAPSVWRLGPGTRLWDSDGLEAGSTELPDCKCCSRLAGGSKAGSPAAIEEEADAARTDNDASFATSARWTVTHKKKQLERHSVDSKPVPRSNNISLRFNGLFPGEPGLAGVYWSKGWWKWWCQLEL